MKDRVLLHKNLIILLLGIITLINPIKIYSQTQPTVIDEIIAIVGRNPILLSDIENEYLNARQQGTVVEGDLKCFVFENILISNLLLNQAVLDSIEVMELNVDAELERRIGIFIGNFGTIERLEEYFSRPIQEIKSELREIIRDELMIDGMKAKIIQDVKITPSEVQKFFRDIPKDKKPYVPTKIELGQIVKYPKVSEAEILRVKELLRTYRQRIVDGEMDFSTMAILYSEDPGSNNKGGRYDDVDKNVLQPEFAAAALKLKPDGLSNLVKTDNGYHIIKLHDRKGDRISFSHILLSPRIENSEIVAVKNELDSIADLIRNKEYTFEDAAREFSENEYTRENGGYFINFEDGSTLLDLSQIDADINYVIKDMNVGEISQSFGMDESLESRRSYKIVWLKSKSKPHIANLKEDYKLIQDSTLTIKRDEVMDNWIREKIKTTYVKIDDSYKNCDFRFDAWIRKD